MATGDKATTDAMIDILKKTKDVNYYSIPATDLSELPKALRELKRHIDEKTRKPKDVLIVVAVR